MFHSMHLMSEVYGLGNLQPSDFTSSNANYVQIFKDMQSGASRLMNEDSTRW